MVLPAETETLPTLRADARRNLERILEAARETFAERGVDAPVTEVAERAGVGVATIFRRFPTKDDLLVAVVEQRTRHLLSLADAALAHEHPGTGLREFMVAFAELHVLDRGFCDAAETDLFAREGPRQLIDEVLQRIRALLRRARATGDVRADITAEDIPVLVIGVAQAGLMVEDVAPGMWRRYLGVMLDGLQPESAHPLARRPLTRRQFEAARDCCRS